MFQPQCVVIQVLTVWTPQTLGRSPTTSEFGSTVNSPSRKSYCFNHLVVFHPLKQTKATYPLLKTKRRQFVSESFPNEKKTCLNPMSTWFSPAWKKAIPNAPKTIFLTFFSARAQSIPSCRKIISATSPWQQSTIHTDQTGPFHTHRIHVMYILPTFGWFCLVNV